MKRRFPFAPGVIEQTRRAVRPWVAALKAAAVTTLVLAALGSMCAIAFGVAGYLAGKGTLL